MIKPVLGSSYRQYILSLWLPFYLSLPHLLPATARRKAGRRLFTVVGVFRALQVGGLYFEFYLPIIFHAMRCDGN